MIDFTNNWIQLAIFELIFAAIAIPFLLYILSKKH